MKITERCFWCKGKSFDEIAERSDGIGVISCKLCGLIQVAKSPPDLEEYYDASYYTPEHKTEDVGYDDYYTLINPLFLLWESALIDTITDPGKKYSLLDVGCATGNLIEIIDRYNVNIVTKGIDISDYAVEHCRKKGLDVEKAYINKYKSQKYNLITSLETLEHLDDLQTFLEGVKRNLTNEGAFIFYVPSVSRIEVEDRSKIDLRLRTNLEHLIYFTPEFFNVEFPAFFKTDVHIQEIVSSYGRSIVGIVTNNKNMLEEFRSLFSHLSQKTISPTKINKFKDNYLKNLIIISAKFYETGLTNKLLHDYIKRQSVSDFEKYYAQSIIDYHNGHLESSIKGLIEYYSHNPNDITVLKIILSNSLIYNRILLDETSKLHGFESQIAATESELRAHRESPIIRNAMRAHNLAKRVKKLRRSSQ